VEGGGKKEKEVEVEVDLVDGEKRNAESHGPISSHMRISPDNLT
jgi:hypothetical protein